MSDFNIKITMEQAWSIDDRGFLQIEVTPKGRPEHILGRLLLNDDLLIEALEGDIEDSAVFGETFDPTDWVNLKNSLRDIADQIEEKLESV